MVTREHVLGALEMLMPQSFILCCDWVIACAGLEGDDCHHPLAAEPPLCVLLCGHMCGSQAQAWDAPGPVLMC